MAEARRSVIPLTKSKRPGLAPVCWQPADTPDQVKRGPSLFRMRSRSVAHWPTRCVDGAPATGQRLIVICQCPDSSPMARQLINLSLGAEGPLSNIQMMLGVDLHNGGSIGIVGPTVFALGADDHYIVVKQHPAKDSFGNFDQTVTHYFIVTRISGNAAEKEKGVRGPLSKDEFARLAVSKSLPRFTKTFRDLE